MKLSTRQLFPSAAVAFFFTLTLAAFAQEATQTDPVPPPPPADTATPTVAPVESSEIPVATPADGTPAPSVEPAPTVEPTPEMAAPDAPKLRRLDIEEDSHTPKTRKEIMRERVERAKQRAAERRAASVGRDIVNVFGDSELPKGEKADNVVSVFGSSTAEGDVTDSVVSVFGSTRAEGSVNDAVAVLGDTEVNGPVNDVALAVFGNLTVNSHVRGDVVAVLGDLKLGPAAVVDGQVICVGGTVTRDPQAVLRHSIQSVGWRHGTHGLVGIKAWLRECLAYGRPLAFAPNLMWAWWIAMGFLAFYVVVALLFGKGVNKCVDTLVQRPGYSILTALLTILLAPIAMIVLAITGIGVAVIPFLVAALFIATLFGKVVMLAWIGRRIGRLLGMDHPALAVLIGGVIVLFLYTIPAVGFILYKLLGWIGVGVVVYTLILGMKREKPARPIAPVVPPSPGLISGDPTTGAAALAPGLAAPVVAGPVPLPPIVPVPALALPRAGFWIRLAALLLDVVIVGMICGLLSGMFGSSSHVRIRADLLPALAVYGAVMWKLRGSTVGGIVCGLKVIRLDDRPLDWGTTIVRALGCFLSLMVCGLGFIWVVFDDQRQSWHDKIAGTTVVRAPKGVSLV